MLSAAGNSGEQQHQLRQALELTIAAWIETEPCSLLGLTLAQVMRGDMAQKIDLEFTIFTSKNTKLDPQFSVMFFYKTLS